MAQSSQQSYANHRRFLPGFHFFASPVLIANVIVWLVLAMRAPSLMAFWYVVVSLALVATMFSARIMALTVQNRVIRLEQQLRMMRVLPPDMQADIGALALRQMIALRFASDAELPDLVRRCRAGTLDSPKAIKQAIRDWQPDFLRA